MPTVKLENGNSICHKIYKHFAWDEKIMRLDSTFTI
jgi:hypothetical protein